MINLIICSRNKYWLQTYNLRNCRAVLIETEENLVSIFLLMPTYPSHTLRYYKLVNPISKPVHLCPTYTGVNVKRFYSNFFESNRVTL